MTQRMQITGPFDPPGHDVTLVTTGGQWTAGMEVEAGRRLWRVAGVRYQPDGTLQVRLLEQTVPTRRMTIWLDELLEKPPCQPRRNAAARAAGLRKLRGRW